MPPGRSGPLAAMRERPGRGGSEGIGAVQRRLVANPRCALPTRPLAPTTLSPGERGLRRTAMTVECPAVDQVAWRHAPLTCH